MDLDNKILHGDCNDELLKIENNSIDCIVTDPPYGYSFMGKEWDRAVIGVETWKKCLNVLKPGAFALIMSAPRQDVLSRMIVNLEDAGFIVSFTPIFWVYSNGFPKAGNVGKMIDKKLGCERKVIGTKKNTLGSGSEYSFNNDNEKAQSKTINLTEPYSDDAKRLNGSYSGFQPKPATEVVIVVMKPLSEKNYTDQAIHNGKGITWLDNCKIPFTDDNDKWIGKTHGHGALIYGEYKTEKLTYPDSKGRFPANILISDSILGSKFSKYFDLDAWNKMNNCKFIETPKPAPSEKEKGLTKFFGKNPEDIPKNNKKHNKNNNHPTVKPVKLMKYLINLVSKDKDLVLDPFLGSGTTAIAASMTARRWIGIESDLDSVNVARGRIDDYLNQNKMSDYVE